MNDSLTTAVIRESLTRILENARFASSPQMSAFLRYVVEEAVAGNADRIKAYSVAVDALGKPESFDAQKDPCVRVLAMRLRESLADYYLEHEEPVVITIPRGSYKPSFTFSTDIPAPPLEPESATVGPSGVTNSAMTAPIAAVAVPDEADSFQSAVPEAEQSETASSILPLQPGLPKPILQPLSRPQVQRWIAASVALMLVTGIVISKRQQPPAEEIDSASTIQIPPLATTQQTDRTAQPQPATIDKTLRPRPNLPTVHIYARPDSDELIRQIGIAVSGVLAKFKNLVVIRNHVGISQADAWPEDYELKGNAVAINDIIRVNAEVIHAASGAIAYTAAFEVAQHDGDFFTSRVIEMIEAFAAQLARHDGPLISDYRQRDGIRPELACLYDLQDQHDQESGTGNHINQAHDHGAELAAAHSDQCGIIPSLLDNTRISSIMLSANLELNAALHSKVPKDQQKILENAVSLAEQAVTLGPYRADTHAMLMRTSHLAGHLEEALVHGARSMELNPFDSHFLRLYSTLLFEVNEKEQAESVKAMANKLDPLG